MVQVDKMKQIYCWQMTTYGPLIWPVMPRSGLSLPIRAWSRVLLPAPEAPMIAKVLPGLALPWTFCSIFFVPPPFRVVQTLKFDQEMVDMSSQWTNAGTHTLSLTMGQLVVKMSGKRYQFSHTHVVGIQLCNISCILPGLVWGVVLLFVLFLHNRT